MKSRKNKISLLLVDDHPVVRKGILSCLQKQSRFEVVGEAANGRQAIAKARELSPDIVLMDVEMPELDGLEATKLLHKESPATKVLILSVNNHKESILNIIRSGAKGYVLKGATTEDLVQAIETIAAGETFFSPEVAKLVLNHCVDASVKSEASPIAKLTERELQVLAKIADGQSNKDIAVEFDVSVRTVEAHRERIMRKLNIHSVVGLTRFAISNHIIEVNYGPTQGRPLLTLSSH
jgi:DNA-binding NarL/FixJ family response regulator